MRLSHHRHHHSAAATATTTTTATIKPPVDSTTPSSLGHSFPYESKTDDHRHKRVKLENETDQGNYPTLTNNFPYKSSNTVNLMQPPSTIGHYITPQTPPILHRQATSTNNYGRISYPHSISPTHPPHLNSDVLIDN